MDVEYWPVMRRYTVREQMEKKIKVVTSSPVISKKIAIKMMCACMHVLILIRIQQVDLTIMSSDIL